MPSSPSSVLVTDRRPEGKENELFGVGEPGKFAMLFLFAILKFSKDRSPSDRSVAWAQKRTVEVLPPVLADGAAWHTRPFQADADLPVVSIVINRLFHAAVAGHLPINRNHGSKLSGLEQQSEKMFGV